MTQRHKMWAIFGMVFLLIGGGLGWKIFRPRPLNIGLRVEPATSQNPLMGDPFATRLSVLPAPETPPQNQIVSGECVWTLRSVRYRRDAKSPWKEITPDSQGQKTPVVLASRSQKVGYIDTFIPNYAQPGEWKSVVRADVSYRTLWSRWHGSVSHEFHDIVTAQDLKSRANKRLLIKRENDKAIAEDAQNPVPNGAVALVPGKRYVGKVQWSEDSGQTWRDVPAANQEAIAVPQLTSLGLRAVKADPKTEWPNYPEFLPYWKYRGEKFFGDTVYLGTPTVSSDANDLRTATVFCGWQIPVKFRVLPPGDLVVYASRATVRRGNTTTKNASATRIHARFNARTIPPGAKVRFLAYNADGTLADIINKPGFKDDVVPLKGNTASATLRDAARPGPITIIANLGSKDNQLLANSDVNASVEFVTAVPNNAAPAAIKKP